MDKEKLKRIIKFDGMNDKFADIYNATHQETEYQKRRYVEAIEEFEKYFPENDDIEIYSAPGRTEVCGNHTDHQNGCVLAAAINLDIIGVVSFNESGLIRLKSKGYDKIVVDTGSLAIREDEKGKSDALIRGILYKFSQLGVKVGGFDIYTTSDVLSGSGLSSSAAFENLFGTIIDLKYNDGKAGAVEIAKYGQFAENKFFGKNSGLMDQMASSVGGFVYIDFKDNENPVIEKIDSIFEKSGYSIIITDTKGSHADLTDDYTAVRSEMEEIAAYFGKKTLRETDESEFFASIKKLRENHSDRAILRAIHFFNEDRRVATMKELLEKNDFEGFIDIVNESGESSAEFLQNNYSSKKLSEQGIPLAIAVSKTVLKGKGAVRVHGGGFAGTIQAFVPNSMKIEYINSLEKIYGKNSCYVLNLRKYGGIEVTSEK